MCGISDIIGSRNKFRTLPMRYIYFFGDCIIKVGVFRPEGAKDPFLENPPVAMPLQRVCKLNLFLKRLQECRVPQEQFLPQWSLPAITAEHCLAYS